MTEQQATNDSVVEEAAPAPQALSPEKIAELKATFVQKSYKLYSSFIEALNVVPAENFRKSMAYQYLDTGMFWFEKAIMSAAFQAEAVDPTPTPPVDPELDAA